MLFDRVKPLDAILLTAEKKGLHRSLGAFQLTMLGIGGVIGTGIFVLTSEAAQKAGPGMLLSFCVAGFVCAVAALCYAELASMVPVSGSAYTYTYAVVGELLAWMVGWALILEYAVGASAVAVGWSNHAVGLLKGLGVAFPNAISNADALNAKVLLSFGTAPTPDLLTALNTGGWINIPAVVITGVITWLLIIGTTESARVNAILVAIKILALTAFVALTLPVLNSDHFNSLSEPFLPTGTSGVFGAAASIFFAYVGFDAVSTAAEETKNPQRNVPIGLIASLSICTVFYLLVASGAIGAIGAQPLLGANGLSLAPGSAEMAGRCVSVVAKGAIEPLVCSKEALVHVLDVIGHPGVGRLVGLAAVIALPSVVLIMMFGQTRVFFTMARDGLLPDRLASVHSRYRTPHVVTLVTGLGAAVAAAFLPVGKLADYSNSGTLFAFMMVAISVMVLRKTDPDRKRPFRTPAVWLIGALTIVGCFYLYISLPLTAILVLPGWGILGLIIYFFYSRAHSHVGRGIV
ncbi:APA family basic amino acid/polyamine antiporter [Sphingomonas vulcanisoli]|uniref:APA family basic amino acid/polyamine antiporter n=1 Tax=Sphingomonas vulcanisoli TaxID=1658060 RepID=A0ABX0TRL0_9SPHN|nr:amino acid permease [Sphingomonas vulcanisoli]NIJ08169.1 APA family basic amino acid/polyamine antiporter [Sphingomonas vulcanisoli]